MKKSIRLEPDIYPVISKHARDRKIPIAQVIQEYVDVELPKAEKLAKAAGTR